MERMMRLVVPSLDGGMLLPIFTSVNDSIGNFSVRSGYDFRVDIPGHFENQTEFDSVDLNVTCSLNATHVDFGRPLLTWYMGRVASQAPLFAAAAVVWFALLGCLIANFLCIQRAERPSSRSYAMRAKRHQLKPALFGLLTGVMLLIVVGCVLAILHWAGRARFAGMSEPGSNGNATAADARSPARTHLTATFQRTIDKFDSFVENSIIDTNATVLTVCREELPNVLGTLEKVATYLLDRLAADFKLSPLLESFDEFIALVKLLIENMRVVKESRLEVSSPLAEFTTLVESARRDLAKQVSDVCRDAGASAAAPPGDLCDRVSSDLTQLAVGVDYRQLDTDSSVTIVTLLEKMLKLNFSQVEDQVGMAKGQLYGSLDLVKDEVKKLFNQLVVAVSTQFENALVDAELFRSNLRNAKYDPGFISAMEVTDKVVLGLSISLGMGSFVFLAVLCLALFVSIRYMLSFRDDKSSNGKSGKDEVDHAITSSPLEPSKSPLTKGSAYEKTAQKASLLWSTDNPPLPRRRQTSRSAVPRDWHSTCLMLSSLLILGALIYASVVFYAGSEVHMDVCRYLTTETGIAKVDQLTNNLIQEKLWPQIRTLLDREVKIPLGITGNQIPDQLLGPIMKYCTNGTTTIFQALDLGRIINVTRILRSTMVRRELAKGSDVIQDLVRKLNTSNIIPSDVDVLLQNTLPSFAAVIDAENFTPSIEELRKPLLKIGSRWPSLRGDLNQLVSSVIHRDPNDRRAVLIRYFSDHTDSLIAQWNRTLSAKLQTLLEHYTTLQTNRRLSNLTVKLTHNAMDLKVTLTDKQLLLSSIRDRYNETIEQHMGAVISLVRDILDKLQTRVGKCRELHEVLMISVDWCRSQIQPLPYTGLYLMASCLAFYILIHLMLVFMHLIRQQTQTEVDDGL